MIDVCQGLIIMSVIVGVLAGFSIGTAWRDLQRKNKP